VTAVGAFFIGVGVGAFVIAVANRIQARYEQRVNAEAARRAYRRALRYTQGGR